MVWSLEMIFGVWVYSFFAKTLAVQIIDVWKSQPFVYSPILGPHQNIAWVQVPYSIAFHEPTGTEGYHSMLHTWGRCWDVPKRWVLGYELELSFCFCWGPWLLSESIPNTDCGRTPDGGWTCFLVSAHSNHFSFNISATIENEKGYHLWTHHVLFVCFLFATGPSQRQQTDCRACQLVIALCGSWCVPRQGLLRWTLSNQFFPESFGWEENRWWTQVLLAASKYLFIPL